MQRQGESWSMKWQMVPVVDWDCVDWTQTDTQTAREIHRSQQRVGYTRQQLGMPPSVYKGCPAHSVALHQAAQRGELEGLSQSQIMQRFGVSLSTLSRVQQRYNIPRRGRDKKYPAHLFDWRLPNRDLGLLWSLPCLYVAKLRYRKKLPRAQWSIRKGCIPGDLEYFAALDAQCIVARQWQQAAQ